MFRRWIQIPLLSSATIALVIFGFLTCNAFAVAGQNVEVVGGATIQNLNPELAKELGFAPNMPGVVVMAVSPASPARNSGMLPGDVITAVNNTPVQTATELKDTIWWLGVTPVTFSVIRGGENYVFTFPVW